MFPYYYNFYFLYSIDIDLCYLHRLKDNLNLRIRTEPVPVGADATVCNMSGWSRCNSMQYVWLEQMQRYAICLVSVPCLKKPDIHIPVYSV